MNRVLSFIQRTGINDDFKAIVETLFIFFTPLVFSYGLANFARSLRLSNRNTRPMTNEERQRLTQFYIKMMDDTFRSIENRDPFAREEDELDIVEEEDDYGYE
ncbi:hypothetical protein RF11_03127 [Thelohanellus kitauei]|uniref:Uncharacterized protein n=1 Tax=Thelohanellus kitauei TaxID=669202 RepID=A0A0C2NFB5_THEKT|nr:hypothetical protein RF11_03127 [Thelohanellus kitauei]